MLPGQEIVASIVSENFMYNLQEFLHWNTMALRYKPEGRGFYSRWCERNFSLTKSIRPHYNTVTEISTKNFSWGKGGRFVVLKLYHLHVPMLMKSGSLSFLESSGPVQDLLYLYIDRLRRLRFGVRKKRPEKLWTNNWFFLDHNAPAHRSRLLSKQQHDNSHPLYSPKLSPVERDVEGKALLWC